jgi:hypothetical protein
MSSNGSRSCALPLLIAGLLVAAGGALHAGERNPYVRERDGVVRGAPSAPLGTPPSILAATAPCAIVDALAFHGQPVPGGGTLSPVAFVNPATVNAAGRLAFFAPVAGAARNQGIFVADATGGLVPIAMGCGGGGGSGVPGGGCGDPTPLGGTFSGMFGGTFFAPSINAAGDVLFLSDVDGGARPRGLFLHRESTGQIEVVAAVGDPSPLGGTFGAVGPGSLNDAGTVAFLGSGGSGTAADVFLWKNGVITKVVAVGDPAPLGGTFTLIGTESLGFADGTSIPGGPCPAINELEQITFRGIVSGGVAERGLFRSQAGVHAWLVRAGDAAPGGGTFFDFQAANLNDAGEIAFFADFQPTPTSFSSGWFAGPPASLRRALAFFDPLDGGAQCFGLAFSRNPMTALDDQGNVAIWTDAQFPGGAMQERIVVSSRDGNVTTAARAGDPTPLGGAFGTMQAWPSLSPADHLTVSCAAPGSSALTAHFRSSGVLTWFDLGKGKPGISGTPRLVGDGALTPGTPGSLRLSRAAPNAAAFLFVGLAEANLPLLGGTLVPAPTLAPLVATTSAQGGFQIAWPAWPAAIPPCSRIWFQWWIADPVATLGAAASNGLRATPQ